MSTQLLCMVVNADRYHLRWVAELQSSAVGGVGMKALRIAVLALIVFLAGISLATAQDGRARPTSGKSAAVQAPVFHYVFGPSVRIGAGQEAGEDVPCPAGEVPTGGGMGSAVTGNVNPDYMYATGRDWIVRAKNWGSTAEDMAPFVICTAGTSVGPFPTEGLKLPKASH
ncbi:hypothetical protein [Streptomyces sp. NPDC008001]|uniref:hypothetical protein n=1 Tax=Streptomyces sp. NPDC008001 TaxID=3364804 RepID=UPI0036E77BDD